MLVEVLLSLGAGTAELCSFPFLPYQRHGFGRILLMGSGIGAEKRHEVGFPTDGRIYAKYAVSHCLTVRSNELRPLLCLAGKVDGDFLVDVGFAGIRGEPDVEYGIPGIGFDQISALNRRDLSDVPHPKLILPARDTRQVEQQTVAGRRPGFGNHAQSLTRTAQRGQGRRNVAALAVDFPAKWRLFSRANKNSTA